MNNFQYIKNKQINREKWDKCISESINSRVYALSWYLDIVCKNWDGIIFGDYDVVFPVVFKKIFFFKESYHPLFCQQLGPFYQKKNLINRNFIESFNEILTKYFTSHIYHITFEYNLELRDKYDFKNMLSFNCKKSSFLDFQHRTNLVIHLGKTYDQLKSSYNKNTIRNLKKSSQFKLKITHEIEPDKFMDLYKKNKNIRASIQKFYPFKMSNYSIVKQLISTCLSKKMGQLIAVFDQEENIISAAFFLNCFKRKIMLFNVTHPKKNQYHSMTFLIDYFIKSHSKKDMLLDFEGSNIEGVKKFYNGFGSFNQPYSMVTKRYGMKRD